LLTRRILWRLVKAAADVDAARAEFGKDGLVAASANIESRSEEAAVTVASTPVTAMAMPATVHAMSATMATTMTAMPGRSRGDRGRRQSESSDRCERNLAKHLSSPSRA